MKKIIRNWKQLIIAVAMIFSVVSTNLSTVSADGGTASFTWGEEIMYPSWLGNWSTKMCYVNGSLAYCLEASKDTPPENTNARYVISTNEALLKVLYYGYGGPADIFKDDTVSTDKEKYLFTHIMASYAYSGDLYGGNTWDYLTSIGVGLKARYDQIQSMPLPTNTLTFNGSNNFTTNAYFEESSKKQRTEDITLNTNESATINIPLQDGVELHNVTKGTVSTGTVAVNGGDTFYLSAPMKALDDYSSGQLSGNNLLRYAPLVIQGTENYQSEGSLSRVQDPATIQLNVNWLKVGSLELTKTNTNKDLIDGAVFNLKSVSFDGYDENITVTDGKIKVDNLLAGTYKLKEVLAPDGYLLDETEYEVTINVGETTSKVVENNEPTGSVSLTKEINTALTDGKSGDAYLQGNEYKLIAREDITNKAGTVTYFNKGDVVDTQTTDNAGKLVFDDLHIGKYYIEESKSNESLVLNSKDINVDIEYEGQTVSKVLRSTNTDNRVNMQKIQIHKSGEKDGISGLVKGLQGAEFTFKLKSEVDHVGWDNAEVYDVITTDENGRANTKYLPYGEYLVRETKTPKDYITAPDFTVSVTKDYSEYPDIAQIKIIDINNRPYTTQLKLVKKDLDSNKTVTLNSATFKVKAREDIVSNGKIIYKAGETIKQKVGSKTYDSFTTSADNVVIPSGSYNVNDSDKGTIVLPLQLDAGKYYIDEIKTPTGYLSLEGRVEFDVENIRDYDRDPDGDPILEVVIKNDKPVGELEVYKDVSYGILAVPNSLERAHLGDGYDFVDRSDLSKIKFRLTAKEDILDMADGSIVYAKGALVGEYNLDRSGYLKVSDLPMGTYELQEIETLDGVVLDETKYEVKFEQTDLTTKVYNVTKELVNEPTIVEISKTDVTGEAELPGAKMSVIDDEGNIIAEWISGENAMVIQGLSVGKTYTLKEDLAPLGYVQAKEIKFTVASTTDIQKVQMIDKVVTVRKAETNGKAVEGAVLQVVSNKTKNIVDQWTVDAGGNHNVRGLLAGETYILKEINVPKGYVKADDMMFTVVDDNKDQMIEMTDNQVQVIKEDEEGSLLKGARLQVINNKTNEIVDEWISGRHIIDISEEMKSLLQKGETINDMYIDEEDSSVLYRITPNKDAKDYTLMLQSNGETEYYRIDIEGNETSHLVRGLNQNDEYLLKEVEAPKGYATAATQDLKVDNKDIVLKMVDEITKIEISKLDITTSKELPGAHLQVSDEEGNIVDSWISGEEAHMIKGLCVGETYTLTETIAPDGYQVAQSIEFTVDDTGNVQRIEMYDELLPSSGGVNTSDSISTSTSAMAALASISALGMVSYAMYEFFKKRYN